MGVKMSEMPGDRLARNERDRGDRSPTDPHNFMRETGPIPLPIPDLGEPIPVPVSNTGIGDHPGPFRLGRRPSLTRHSCGAHVLVGLDADRCAMNARCEPYPLTALGEVEALRAGRWTYRLFQGALDHRDRWNIPGHPPTPEVPVLAAHICGEPLPAEWLAPPPPRPARQPAAEGMPF